jgi:biopolymer transport protein ExbB
MSTQSVLATKLYSWMAAIVLPMALIIGYLVYTYILGDGANFEGGLNTNEPLSGNYLGVIYKGGPLVILLIAFQVTLLTYAMERFMALRESRGKIDNRTFALEVKSRLKQDDLSGIIELCDVQKGALANVVKAGLMAYQDWTKNQPIEINNETKTEWLQNELEEATQLELPLLNRNMIVISTLAQISTLVGLLGTVTGMIIAFSALARVGAPDAVALAGGISQALVTTALGISTAAVAIVLFNFFTNAIEKVTYAIDEATFSIVQHYKLKGA